MDSLWMGGDKQFASIFFCFYSLLVFQSQASFSAFIVISLYSL